MIRAFSPHEPERNNMNKHELVDYCLPSVLSFFCSFRHTDSTLNNHEASPSIIRFNLVPLWQAKEELLH
jgi:hypothetical protein